MKKHYRKEVLMGELVLMLLMPLMYHFNIVEIFGYFGFEEAPVDILKIFFVTLITVVFIIMGIRIQNEFYYFTYHSLLCIALIPQTSYYMLSNLSIMTMMNTAIALILLRGVSLFDQPSVYIRRVCIRWNDISMLIFLGICLICLLPFAKNIPHINLKNLIFQEVYHSRFLIRENASFLISRLLGPLSRTVFPFLAVYAITNKKRGLYFLTIGMNAFIYLTSGAQKDTLVGFVVASFFAFFFNMKGLVYLIRLIGAGFAFEILLYKFTGLRLLTTYIRRVFYYPTYLSDKYITYYQKDGFTHFAQSPIGFFTGGKQYDFSLSRWFGENVLKDQGLNANTGIFTEGYISYGILGVLVLSTIFVLVCILMRKLNLDNRYLGIWFLYIYICLNSFMGVVFMTHGLLVQIIFALFLIPSQDKEAEYSFFRGRNET